MLDWNTLDTALATGTASETVNPDDLFDLTRSLVFTTVADTLEQSTGRMRSSDILMLVDTVYDRFCSMPAETLAAQRNENGDALNMLHAIARDATMDYVRAVHYPKASLARILTLMGGGTNALAEFAKHVDNPLDSTQRVVLMIRHGEGLSPSQTADLLGVSNNEVRTIEAAAHEAIALHLCAPAGSAVLH